MLRIRTAPPSHPTNSYSDSMFSTSSFSTDGVSLTRHASKRALLLIPQPVCQNETHFALVSPKMLCDSAFK